MATLQEIQAILKGKPIESGNSLKVVDRPTGGAVSAVNPQYSNVSGYDLQNTLPTEAFQSTTTPTIEQKLAPKVVGAYGNEAPSYVKPEEGLGKQVVKGVIKPFAQVYKGASALVPAITSKFVSDPDVKKQLEQMSFERAYSPTKLGSLGEIEAPTYSTKEGLGIGLEIGTWFTGAGLAAKTGKGIVTNAVLNSIKTGTPVASNLVRQAFWNVVKQGAKEGAITGFSGSLGASMQDKDKTFTDNIVDGLIGTLAGGTLGAGIAGTGAGISIAANKTKFLQKQFVKELINNGVDATTANKIAKEGGFFGNFGQSPKAQEIMSKINSQEVLLQQALADGKKQVADRFAKNIKLLNKELQKENQGGFIKNPFAKKASNEFNITAPKTTGIFDETRRTLNPVNFVDENTKKAYQKYSSKGFIAQELANKEASKLANLPTGEEGVALMHHIQAGRETPYTNQVSQVFDGLFDEATKRLSLDKPIGYQSGYLPQYYNNTREEVMNAMARYMKDNGVEDKVIRDYVSGIAELPANVSGKLKLTPNFANEKVFPDYSTAMSYGLKPKYSSVQQLAGQYRLDLEKAVASKGFLDDLVNSGSLKSPKSAPKGWIPVNFGPARGAFAEPKVAKLLNGVFFDESTIGAGDILAKGLSKASKVGQEISLSGGIPRTKVNFFAMGQGIKNITTAIGSFMKGDLSGGMNDLKLAKVFLSPSLHKNDITELTKMGKYFKMMAEDGIPTPNKITDFQKLYGIASETLGQKVGRGFNRAFNEKTFEVAMPLQMAKTYEGILNQSLAKGMGEGEARKLATDVTKNFLGILMDTGRGKQTQNVLSSIFFAPRFREAIVRTLWNVGKSVTSDIRNPAYAKSRSLAIGMATTFGLYNLLNYKLNGHMMWGNETGKEGDLKIPLKNGDFVYIPFMPSFMSLPRAIYTMGSSVVKGDLATATQKGSSMLSMPIKLLGEVATNRDYFGRPIVNPNDTRMEKIQSVARYFGLGYNHPYVKAVVNYVYPKDPTKQKPLLQYISEGMELPLKFNTADNVSRSKMFQAEKEHQDQLNKAKNKFKPVYEHILDLAKQGKKDEANKLIGDLPDEDYAIFENMYSADQRKKNYDKEPPIYRKIEQIRSLADKNKKDEANAIINAMSDEEYDIFEKLWKKTEVKD